MIFIVIQFHNYLHDNYFHEVLDVRLQVESGNLCLAAAPVFFIRNELSGFKMDVS